MSNENSFIGEVEKFFTDRISRHGPGHLAVDWNSHESQFLRFRQLLRLAEGRTAFTINDFGCGYGALVDYLTERFDFNYFGFDISTAMIEEARKIYKDHANCTFSDDRSDLRPRDLTVASGVFHAKLDTPDDVWERHVKETLDEIATLSEAGFSFNLLTTYSDPDRMQSHLYYAEPARWFDYCKQRFSRNVALLHDYNVYEFSVLVRFL